MGERVNELENATYKTIEEAADAVLGNERERRYEAAAIASIRASDLCGGGEGSKLWMQQAQVYATLHLARVTDEHMEFTG